MKNIYLTLLGLVLANSAISQSNISWEAETKFEYFLERQNIFNFETEDTKNGMECGKSYSQMVKFDLTKSNLEATRFFTENILELLLSRKIYAYSLEDNHRLNLKEIESKAGYDGMILYDPRTFEENFIKIKTFSFKNIISFIIKQKWQFNENTDKLEAIVLGIIPVLETYKYAYHDGKSYTETELIELFWIPFDNTVIDDFDINSPDNIWIKMNIDRVSFTDAKVTIGNSNSFFKKEFWDKPLTNEVAIYDVEKELFFKERLPDGYLRNTFLQSISDTTLIVDSQLNTEILQINTNSPLQFSDIVGYTIYQFWYFNSKSLTLNSKLIAIEPLISIHKEVFKEKHCFYQTLYHRFFQN